VGEYRYISTLSLTSALDGVGGQHHAPAALPLGKTRYPLYRRLGGPQDRSGRVRKISPPTGIRSPDRPVRSQSLYRLSYPGLHSFMNQRSLDSAVSPLNRLRAWRSQARIPACTRGLSLVKMSRVALGPLTVCCSVGIGGKRPGHDGDN
jgi:hypothetical protein